MTNHYNNRLSLIFITNQHHNRAPRNFHYESPIYRSLTKLYILIYWRVNSTRCTKQGIFCPFFFYSSRVTSKAKSGFRRQKNAPPNAENRVWRCSALVSRLSHHRQCFLDALKASPCVLPGCQCTYTYFSPLGGSLFSNESSWKPETQPNGTSVFRASRNTFCQVNRVEYPKLNQTTPYGTVWLSF